MHTLKRGTKRATKVWIPLFLGLLVLAIALAILLPIVFARTMMTAETQSTSLQQFALLTPGSHTTIVLEVDKLPAHDLIQGTLLEKNSDGSYSHTPQTVQVQWNPQQKITMGNSTDIKQNAVIQVSGQLLRHDVITASQLVVLTNVVQLK